jgi:hypothetical protein
MVAGVLVTPIHVMICFHQVVDSDGVSQLFTVRSCFSAITKSMFWSNVCHSASCFFFAKAPYHCTGHLVYRLCKCCCCWIEEGNVVFVDWEMGSLSRAAHIRSMKCPSSMLSPRASDCLQFPTSIPQPVPIQWSASRLPTVPCIH